MKYEFKMFWVLSKVEMSKISYLFIQNVVIDVFDIWKFDTQFAMFKQMIASKSIVTQMPDI